MNRMLLGLLLLAVGTLAWAEGSRNLHPSGASGLRAWLEYNTSGLTTFAGIPRRNSIEVYAQAGEVIALGSSAHGLGSTGGIRYTTPSGTSGNCIGTGPGRIANRTEEVNGPRYPGGGNSAGFAPCYVTVPAGETGIWRVEFLGPDGAATNPPTGLLANAIWSQPSTGSLIAAWDVTVFQSASSNTPLSGRVWADYLPLNSGGNGNNYVYLNVYVLNNEGYLFSQQQVVDPFGYIFFANNRGFLSSSTGNPVFKSLATSSGVLQAGYSFHRPDQSDSGINVTHKTFFNPPAADLPSEASYWAGGDDWLRLALPILPPQVEDVRFVGKDGTSGQAAGVSGGGGTFYYTNSASETLSVRIVIPLSANGVNVDRVLTGVAPPGEGSLVWDGLDGAGNPIYTSGTLSYNFTATLFGGEIHFPFFDVERSQRLTVRRLNGPSASQWPDDLLYWDHSLVAGSGQPVPLTNLEGLSSSSSPAMSYSGTWGNEKGLDAWTYVPSDQPAVSSEVTVRTADLRIVKTADFAPVGRGGAVAYTLTVDNLSSDTFARDARVQDSFAATLSGLRWSCEIVEPGLLPADQVSACATASGTGNLDALVSLRAGARAVFRIRGTLSAAAGATLSNTATVSRAADAADPALANNTSTVVIATEPGHAISGQVYEDLQGNGVRDGGEDWAAGAPLWVSLVRDTGEVVESLQVNAGAGTYAFAGVPVGPYRLLVTDAELSASVASPAGFQFVAPVSGRLDLVVAGAASGQDFGLRRGGNLLEGRVFEDNGAGGGIAHNGIPDGAESGLAGVSVRLLDAGATQLAETRTAADGFYRFILPATGGDLEVVADTPAGFLSISESAGNIAAPDNPSPFDDRLRFTPAGGSYQGVDFGDVREPVLAPDQVRSSAPGSTLYLPHTFTAPSRGSVRFAVADPLPNPDIPGWDTRLFGDANCNGSLDAGEAVLGAALAVSAGQRHCLLLRVLVPSGAPINAQWRAALRAEMSYADAADQPLRSSARSVQDLVTASEREALVLLKAVDRGTAMAGDVLTYTLTYRNAGADSVSDVEIRDATPAYTVYVGGSAACRLPLPAGIASCTTSEAPAEGGVGAVVWRLGGALPSGAEGRVEYRVRVEGM
ncbi:DUF11 domain-containing protein [Pseudomonas sp. A-1]|uniref:SdrD B-like domain-containing protein n=1 Tax=Pseudomonas sp. A-1 TaxID=1821274 RepID=UPI0010A6617E|nr:DUF11 domain-containing protein [Pseudomonas sp. A-1]THG82225.1 DUF11 domain-containing protein [Pseudomonas sp. A-1]